MTFRNHYTHTFNMENELVSVVNNGNTTIVAGRQQMGATVHWRRE